MDISEEMRALQLDSSGKEKVEAPVHEVIKAVDINEEAENKKRHLNLVFIGHVDAGKSTIGGQILLLSGQVDDRTIQKYEKEAKDKARDSWFGTSSLAMSA